VRRLNRFAWAAALSCVFGCVFPGYRQPVVVKVECPHEEPDDEEAAPVPAGRRYRTIPRED
jgi:hypothetical protein